LTAWYGSVMIFSRTWAKSVTVFSSAATPVTVTFSKTTPRRRPSGL
jgi:hypothetical protein